MRVLATADWQLGKKISGAGSKAPQFREQLFLTSENIITKLALEHKVDLIVICGDLFDRPDAPWDLIERTATMLSKSEIPIHIIAGNHDALEGSQRTALWNLQRDLGDDSKVIIHTKRESNYIEHLNCTIYPGVLNERFDNSDQTSWIPERQKNDGVRIGLFHGSIANIGGGEQRIATLDPTLALDRELDIALLGDWHGPSGDIENSLIDQPENRLWYTGAPEAQIRSQNWIGRILICDLESEKAPQVSSIEVGLNRFIDLNIEFQEDSPESGFSELDEQCEQNLTSSDDLIAWRITTTGWLSKNDHGILTSKVKELQQQFTDLDFKDKVNIMVDKLTDSSGIIEQISAAINDSQESLEVKQTSLRLLYKFARQELGGDVNGS